MSDLMKLLMAAYENGLQLLDDKDLLHELEELTIKLASGQADRGDFQRQMLIKRVILRRMGSIFTVRPQFIFQQQQEQPHGEAQTEF